MSKGAGEIRGGWKFNVFRPHSRAVRRFQCIHIFVRQRNFIRLLIGIQEGACLILTPNVFHLLLRPSFPRSLQCFSASRPTCFAHKPAAKRTLIPGVLGSIGGFGALFEVSRDFRNPVLVTGTDGVGTKLMLAFQLGRHDTVGQDLVAMSVNDILVQGAKSLFFLDYYACGKLDVDVAERVVKGVAKGCELAGCALIGGETAEMPGMYPEGEYDLAGFAVGVVEKDEIIDGTTIKPGDVVLGLASSGPHSNGFSLLRKVVEVAGADWSMPFDGATLADRAMEPTRIYVKQVLSVMKKVQIKGMAHITGGGLIENVPRVLPEGVQCRIDGSSWTRPAIFEWLEEKGQIDSHEMYRVFNNGIGLVVIVSAEDADRAMEAFKAEGEKVFRIGEISTLPAGEAPCVVL